MDFDELAQENQSTSSNNISIKTIFTSHWNTSASAQRYFDLDPLPKNKHTIIFESKPLSRKAYSPRPSEDSLHFFDTWRIVTVLTRNLV